MGFRQTLLAQEKAKEKIGPCNSLQETDENLYIV